MIRGIQTRFYQDKLCTLSTVQLVGIYIPPIFILERPGTGNVKDDPKTPANESTRIPPLEYLLRRHKRPNGDLCLKFTYVPDRTDILMHTANFVEQLKGCQAPGFEIKQDRSRGVSIARSTDALTYLLDIVGDDVLKLEIVETFKV